ncbi:PREDICTED: CAAX prenyl protease 1 homolog [Amphimedon queenslandica]|uniref:CAAX prenyl protease n=1 Tax=Amphimedon queenslandica TaxID=400682 RepID=A0AAN0J3R2_AMPQE|nr:PREDICTED: CAAX prenyl protease 1 homolog [Amphimedon queenslandica]|eukprot:XP_019851377.1 PREDICTED: CAAX prenyl protease 1 homolog [Amphimedon queenslandica]
MDYLWICVFLVLGTTFWEALLSWRQRNVYKTVTKVPQELASVLDQETFDKSRLYQLDQSTYSAIYSVYKVLEFMVIIFIGALPLVWDLSIYTCSYFGYGPDYEVLQTYVFIFICLLYSFLSDKPWKAYHTFIIEEKHGFNKQTLGFFIKDSFKSLVLQCALIPPVIAGIVFIVKWGGTYFFLYAGGFVFIIIVILIMTYHDFIAPCFDKYTPLPDSELKTKIEELASSLKFPLKKLYIVEGSKRSAHSNAYFYGFGSNKRIVLYDTLIEKGILPSEDDKKKEESETDDKEEEEKVNEEEEKTTGCNIEEILAVLCHELGHWNFSHTLKLMAMNQVNIFLTFAIFGYFLNQQDMYESFGFSTRPVIIGLIIVTEMIFSPYNILYGFLIVQLMRSYEYQADDFATKMKRGGPLSSALTKLVKDNLSFPVADPLYANFHHHHPTFLERIRTLKTKIE